MKTKIGTLRKLVREAYKAYKESYNGPLTLEAIPQQLFDVPEPDMSNMTPNEARDALNDIRDNFIDMIRSIQRQAGGNNNPKPGELGIVRTERGKGSIGVDHDPNPELAEFMKKSKKAENEFYRRTKEYDLALKREGDSRWNALSPEEQKKRKLAQAEQDAVYGGSDRRNRGYGLGT